MSQHKSVRYLCISTVNGGPWPRSMDEEWKKVVESAQQLVKQKGSLVLSVSEE